MSLGHNIYSEEVYIPVISELQSFQKFSVFRVVKRQIFIQTYRSFSSCKMTYTPLFITRTVPFFFILGKGANSEIPAQLAL